MVESATVEGTDATAAYGRLHRYALNAESAQFLRREAPFVLALVESPGSRLTQCAKGITPEIAAERFPVTVEVNPYARLVTPTALAAGTIGLLGLTVGNPAVFLGSAAIAGIALYLGRMRQEDWLLGLAMREEEIREVIANASIAHDVPHRLLRMADYPVVTDQSRYFWDQTTYRVWESQGSPERLQTYGLIATVNGEPREGEALRALQV